jgi:hypothetical protein
MHTVNFVIPRLLAPALEAVEHWTGTFYKNNLPSHRSGTWQGLQITAYALPAGRCSDSGQILFSRGTRGHGWTRRLRVCDSMLLRRARGDDEQAGRSRMELLVGL